MTRQIYDKLVRDRIPQIIAAAGRRCAVAVLDEDAFVSALRAKLVEEAQEAAADAAQLAVELADLLEVVEALAAQHGLTLEQVRKLQVQRSAERGSFAQRLKLLWVE